MNKFLDIERIPRKNNKSFINAVVRYLFKPEDKYKEEKLDTSMLEYPVKNDDSIEKFETANKLIINIYRLENYNIKPCRVSPTLKKYYENLITSLDESKKLLTERSFKTLQRKLFKKRCIINLLDQETHYNLICESYPTCYMCFYNASSEDDLLEHIRCCEKTPNLSIYYRSYV